MKKIIGLSCGRKNGNCETLLKSAAMGAEEFGVETEIIRAMELKVLPCRGCQGCLREPYKCILKDDVDWILEKTCMEDCGLIVSVPVYHLRANAYFLAISERMNHFIDKSNRQIIKKTRVGAIISVGGGLADWTSLGLTTANIFVQHTRLLVDQIQVNGAGMRGSVLLDTNKKQLDRVRELGRNVARAMSMPIEEAKFVGEETAVSCPVCHCNVLQVPEDLPHVTCPVCWVHGVISFDGDKMEVKWDEWDINMLDFPNMGVPNMVIT